MKFCKKCQQWKDESEFYKSTNGGCRACVRKYQNAWATAHRIHKLPVVPEGFRFCKQCGQTKSVSEFYHDKSNVSGYHHYCKECVDAGHEKRRKAEIEAKKALLEPVPDGYKKCSRCDETKPKSEFNKGKGKDGLMYHCRECNRAEKKKYYKPPTPEQAERHNKLRAEIRATGRYEEQEKKQRQEYNQRPEVKERKRKFHAKWRDTPERRADARNRTIEWAATHPEEVHQQRYLRNERVKNAEGSYTRKQWLKLVELCGGGCTRCGSHDGRLTRDHIIPITWGGSNWIFNMQPLCHNCNSVKKALFAADYRPLPARAWAYEQTYGTLDEEFDEQATLEWWVKLQALGMGVGVR